MSQSNQIQHWLLCQHIKVPSDWLEACLDWLSSENQMNSQNLVHLQKQVYDQWLVADLNDLSAPTLPNQVNDDKYTLNGIYCLQLMSIVDVSQPFYGQLLKAQNHDDSNTNVSAETQFTQKPWENKPTRMLLMKLTDGVMQVSGMEYRSISSLHDRLSPGCKVRIKGPIECRRGVLMLTPSNIQMLGGEVEEMIPANHHEAILCQRLGRPLPNQSHSAPSTNETPADLPPDLISQLTDEDFNIEQESGYMSATTNPSNSATNNLPNPVNSAFNSTFMELDDSHDVTDMEILEEMDRVESNNTSVVTSSENANTPVPNEVPDQLWEDVNFDANVFASNSNQKNIVDLTNETQLLRTSRPTPGARSKQLCIKDAFDQNFKPLSEPLRQCASRPLVQQESSAQNSTASGSVSSKLSSKKRQYDDEKNVQKQQISSYTPVKCERFSEPQLSVNSVKTAEDTTDHKLLSDLIPSFVAESTTTNPILYKCLCQLSDPTGDGKTNSFLVKACVITLLSKLQSSPVTGWMMEARICDGTGVLDVCFSDLVLTELIGFSSQQAENIKVQNDARQTSDLRAGMARCRKAIIEMCQLMELHITPSRASVERLLDTDQNYWDHIA